MTETNAVPPDCKCPEPSPSMEGPLVRSFKVSRLFNLGDYEHKKIEVTVEVPPGKLPSDLLIRTERILEALGEEAPIDEYAMQAAEREAAKTDEEFKNWHGADRWEEGKAESLKQLADFRAQMEAWKKRQIYARRALDYLHLEAVIDIKLPFES